MNLFEVDHVSWLYAGRHIALDDVSLTIQKGEKIAFLGPNGSGKSTLLRILDGLIFPDIGVVRFMGKELREKTLQGASNRYFRTKVGMLFQNPDTQLFSSTVREEIQFGPAQLGLDRDEVNRRTEHAIGALRIGHLADRTPYELSIGEKKRVAIASIMSVSPDVALLDEPTAGLDPRSCRDLMDIIHEMSDAGKTIVTATHDLHFVGELADTCYVFGENKRIVAAGPTKEILSDTERLKDWNLEHIHRHRHDGDAHEHEHAHVLFHHEHTHHEHDH